MYVCVRLGSPHHVMFFSVTIVNLFSGHMLLITRRDVLAMCVSIALCPILLVLSTSGKHNTSLLLLLFTFLHISMQVENGRMERHALSIKSYHAHTVPMKQIS